MTHYELNKLDCYTFVLELVCTNLVVAISALLTVVFWISFKSFKLSEHLIYYHIMIFKWTFVLRLIHCACFKFMIYLYNSFSYKDYFLLQLLINLQTSLNQCNQTLFWGGVSLLILAQFQLRKWMCHSGSAFDKVLRAHSMIETRLQISAMIVRIDSIKEFDPLATCRSPIYFVREFEKPK